MLFDWLTLRLDSKNCPDWGGWWRVGDWGDRIMRICPRTNTVRWEVAAWDSVRSDSHQLAVSCSAGVLRIQGSPARVMGDGDTVFGAGPAARDVYACASAMIAFAQRHLFIATIPHVRLWRCTRTDITGNFYLGGLPDVRVSLAELRNIEGGRYRVSQTAGDTVYWSHLSKLRSGKAYAKGPHLRHLADSKTYTGRSYSPYELILADKLLRCELKLGNEFFRRLRELNVNWWSLPWAFFENEFNDYFLRMVGDVEVLDMATLLNRLRHVPHPKKPGEYLTDGMVLAAYRTFSSISTLGWQATRDLMPSRTWYLHLQYLKAAGLGDADISAGRVVSLRRRVVMTPVSSWEDLRRAA